MLHQCNRLESFIRAHTKPPQSCEERKPAPPNEEQFNAPTTGGRAINLIAAVLTSRGNSRKVHGPPRIIKQAPYFANENFILKPKSVVVVGYELAEMSGMVFCLSK